MSGKLYTTGPARKQRETGTLTSFGGGDQRVQTGGGGGILAGTGGQGQRVTAYVDGSGTRRQGTSYWDAMGSDLDAAYQAERDYNARTLAAAEQQARDAAAAQIRALTRGYQGTNRQLYRDFMQRQRTLPEQLAAGGYTGGLTESSRLRLGNAYEEALNANEQARLGQEADYGRDLARQLYDARAAAAAADSRALQSYYDRRRELSAQRQQQERAALEQRAATLAARGDFRLYRQLGYTAGEIAYLERMYRRQHPELFKKTGGGGHGGRGGGSAPDPTGTTGPDRIGSRIGYAGLRGGRNVNMTR